MNPGFSNTIVVRISLVLKAATIGLLLSACEGVSVGPSNFSSKNLEGVTLQLSLEQLLQNRETFSSKIYEFIKERHPTIAEDFPNIKIRLIDTSNYWDLESLLQSPDLTFEEVESFFRKTEFEFDVEIKSLLQEVSNRFSSETSTDDVWEVDLIINQVSAVTKTEDYAYGIICIAGNAAAGNWAMLVGFVVCPGDASTDFQVTAFVRTNNSNNPQVIVGYGSAFITTPILMESAMAPQVDRTAAALAAALASGVDGIVLLYQNQKQ